MITSKQCYAKYGDPTREKNMRVWDVPERLEIGAVPKRIYCNKDLVLPLQTAFENLIETGRIGELRTWDGCFNIRQKRGAASMSLHSWGVAIDVNAAWNRFGQRPTMSVEFVTCFKRAGFDWGGDWTRPDGMHFQLARLPE